jgi:hypothetical protein
MATDDLGQTDEQDRRSEYSSSDAETADAFHLVCPTSRFSGGAEGHPLQPVVERRPRVAPYRHRLPPAAGSHHTTALRLTASQRRAALAFGVRF